MNISDLNIDDIVDKAKDTLGLEPQEAEQNQLRSFRVRSTIYGQQKNPDGLHRAAVHDHGK